jgi:hypothetical protein
LRSISKSPGRKSTGEIRKVSKFQCCKLSETKTNSSVPDGCNLRL